MEACVESERRWRGVEGFCWRECEGAFFFFIRRTKDVQLSAQLHFGPGALLPVILLQACDEVIFCVSSGYAHTCACLALWAVKRAMHSSKWQSIPHTSPCCSAGTESVYQISRMSKKEGISRKLEQICDINLSWKTHYWNGRLHK